jgi:poly(3-hydroxybutyrate) depolymerase
MTIEGERDDITGLGQCAAAHRLCRGIPERNKLHFECPSVGHYGIFNGARFRTEIAPRVAHFIRRFDPRNALGSEIAYIDRDLAGYSCLATHEPDSVAFTFAPADDREPQHMARRPEAGGVGALVGFAGGAAGPLGMWMPAGAS